MRKLSQRVQRNYFERKYDELIGTVEQFIKSYPLCSVAQKATTMVKKIIPHCDGTVQQHMTFFCEYLQMLTCDYHSITTLILPHIKLDINLHKKITSSLFNGSPDIELTYHYIISGKYDEELQLLGTNRLNKLQEVAPIYVQLQALQQ